MQYFKKQMQKIVLGYLNDYVCQKKIQGKHTILRTTSLVSLGADQLLIHIFTGTLEYVMGYNVILLCNEKVLILFDFLSLYSLVSD